MKTVNESEMGALGVSIIFGELAREVRDRLEPEMFYSSAHQKIWSAISGLVAAGSVVDYSTLAQKLRADGVLGDVGGPTYLTDLVNYSVRREHLNHHVAEIRRAYFDRQIIAAAHRIAEDPGDENLAELQRLAVVKSAETLERDFDLSKDLPAYLDRKDRAEGGEVLDTGFPFLDKVLGGLKRGNLMTVAGRPGGGKTAFMTKLAVQFAEQGRRGLFFSTEMSAHEIADRILPARSKIPAGKFRRNRFDKADRQVLADACAEIHDKLKIVIIDKARPCIADVRRAAALHKPDVVVLDYLQRFAKPKGENMTRSCDEFMTLFKSFCRDGNFLGVLGAQLNRGLDRGESLPTLADLRDSGSIEHESDVVLLLHTATKDPLEPVREIAGIVAKNRHGASGVVRFRLDGRYVDMLEAERAPAPEAVNDC